MAVSCTARCGIFRPATPPELKEIFVKLLQLVSALILITVTGLAGAQVQECTDKNGKVTYTDTYCPAKVAKEQSMGIAAIAPRSDVAPSGYSGSKDLDTINREFNARHADRARNAANEAYQDNQRALINDFKKPLQPGESRSITITPPDSAAPTPRTKTNR